MTAILKVKDLSVSFNLRNDVFDAVKNISFEVDQNEVIGLVGESGSGKSVTAMSIMRLLPEPKAVFGPESQILFNDQDILKLSQKALTKKRGKDLTMVFQEPMTSLNPFHRVGNQIQEAIMAHQNLSSIEAKRQALRFLELVEIPHPTRLYKSYPHQLSGGQRQRIMIAIALANKPKLLIADEPTTALDVTIQAQILDLINRLKDEVGMSVLFITHDLSLVRKFSHRMVVMKSGEIVEQGITSEIFQNPQHEYTKKLINSEPTSNLRAYEARDAIIQVKNLSVGYSIKSDKLFKKKVFKAVDNLSFSIYKNSTIGLVGESGSGKSTLGKAIAGLINYEGRVLFENNDISKLSPRDTKDIKKDIQIIFQDPYGSLSPRMTIREIIGEGLDVHYRLSKNQRNELIDQSMLDVGLDPKLQFKYPHEFSGGQRQRIAIARSIILNPKFIILDEPTSALDRSIQIQVLDLLKEIQQKMKLTYLFISHDLRVIRSMSDYVFVMQQGKIIEQGNVDKVFNAPSEEYTSELLAAALRYSTE